MPESSQSWSVIIMCYNEKGTIKQVVDECLTLLPSISNNQFEIIPVDDGSTDGSTQIINELAEKYSEIKPVIHGVNKGIGATLRSGYINAKMENVTAIPADGQFDINELIPHKTVSISNFVMFYRVENTTYSVFRNALSWLNKKLNRWLLGVVFKDVNWVKIYKNEHLQNLSLELTSSLVESEICAKMYYSGIQHIECKSKYKSRSYGTSKGASFKIVLQATKDLFKVTRTLKNYK